MSAVRPAFAAMLLAIAAPAHARGSVIHASGAWAAIDRGALCEALSRSVRVAPKGKVQATAGFSFTPDRRRWGEFHARSPRPGPGAGDHRRRASRRGDAHRGSRRGRPPLRRLLLTRWSAHGDRRGRSALRPARRWQNPVTAPR
jgi:hypothetical protein